MVTIACQPERFQRSMPSPYEWAVQQFKPQTYWRFDHDVGGLMLNTVDIHQYQGRYGPNAGLADGPNLVHDQTNRALYLRGDKQAYAMVGDIRSNKNLVNTTTVLLVRPDIVQAQNILVYTNSEGPDIRFSDQLRINRDGCFEAYFFTGLSRLEPDPTRPEALNPLRPNPYQYIIRSNIRAEAGRWYHVTLTVGPQRGVSLYVNGLLAAKGYVDGWPVLDYYHLYIGSSSGSNHPEHNRMNAFQGAIDEIALYERILAPSEIRLLHESWQANSK
jgi:hypothetical protein